MASSHTHIVTLLVSSNDRLHCHFLVVKIDPTCHPKFSAHAHARARARARARANAYARARADTHAHTHIHGKEKISDVTPQI